MFNSWLPFHSRYRYSVLKETTFGEVAKSVGMLTIINKADVMRSGAFRVAHFPPDVFLLNRS